jgi:chromosome partitioning protein
MRNEEKCTRCISVLNQKGGVGKTTTTVNLGAGLSRLGRKVLLIDLDPQAHLSYALGIPVEDLDYSVYNFIKGEVNPEQVMQQRDNLMVLPGSMQLSGMDVEFSGRANKEFMLQRALMANFKDYDYIFMDCPPNLGVLSINALAAASEVFIPLQAEFLALQSLSRLMETVNFVKEELNYQLAVTAIIATRFSKNKRLSREVIYKIREYFPTQLLSTSIRENVALAEAPSYGQDIFSYGPKSNGAFDYLRLAKEVDKMEHL